MNCPYCQKEMEKGYIQSQREVNWSPKEYFCNSSALHSDIIVLGKPHQLKGAAVVAYCCKACEKVIIDYEE